MRTKRILTALIAVGALTLAGSAFAKQAHAHTATVVKTKKTAFGTILVTGSGATLYLDVSDKPGHPACTGGCLSAWPALKTTGTAKASGGAKAAALGTTKIAGGIKQITYDGHPLYTFASDTTSGAINGEGVNGFYVVSPSGAKITKATKTSTTQSSSGSYSSSSGY